MGNYASLSINASIIGQISIGQDISVKCTICNNSMIDATDSYIEIKESSYFHAITRKFGNIQASGRVTNVITLPAKDNVALHSIPNIIDVVARGNDVNTSTYKIIPSIHHFSASLKDYKHVVNGKKLTILLLGSEGVGKSSLINNIKTILTGRESVPTYSLGSSSGVTTSASTIYIDGYDNFCVVDSRGVSSSRSSNKSGIGDKFVEYTETLLSGVEKGFDGNKPNVILLLVSKTDMDNYRIFFDTLHLICKSRQLDILVVLSRADIYGLTKNDLLATSKSFKYIESSKPNITNICELYARQLGINNRNMMVCMTNSILDNVVDMDIDKNIYYILERSLIHARDHSGRIIY